MILLIDLIVPDDVTIGDALGSMVRSCVVAPPGSFLAIADFSAIEARGLPWAAKDHKTLADFRADLDPYKVFATVVFGVPYDQVTKAMRTVCKPPILGAGYQIGGEKLDAYALGMGIDLAKFGWTGEKLVALWRAANPLIAGEDTGEEFEGRVSRKGGLWKDFQYGAMKVVETGREKWVGRCRLFMRGLDFVIRLPSGKEIVYRNAEVGEIDNQWGGTSRQFTFDRPFGGKMVRASQYGGKWVENCVQALCTGSGGLTGASLARLVAAGFDVVLHVHDEIVAEIRSRREFLLFLYLMNELPKWAEGFPNKTVGFTSRRYMKEPPVSLSEDGNGRLVVKRGKETEILNDGFGKIEWRGVSAAEMEWLQEKGLTVAGTRITVESI